MKRFLLATVIAVGVASCRNAPAENTDQTRRDPIPVSTITVRARPLASSMEAGGVIRAVSTATIASRTLATVTAVRVRAGDTVAPGALLVQLDDRDVVAQQRRAEQATTALQRAHAAAIADRDAAAAALGLARTGNERISGLFTRDAATSQERDEAAAGLRGAEAHVAAAEARVAQFAAEVSAAQQTATGADVSASFAAIRAPFGGTVVERLVDPGDLVSPGTPLLRLDGTGAFRLEVAVDEARIGTITPGMRVDVWIDGTAQRLDGQVSEIARATGAGAHAFIVKIAVPAARLRSGLFGRARFATDSREGLALPRRAIASRGQLPTVWVVSNGRARLRVIALGEPVGADDVEVVAGLAAADQVIVAPPPQLRDGDAVTVTGAR